MRPLYRMGLAHAAMALLASGSVAAAPPTDDKPQEKPEPLMTPEGYRKEHQGLRERTRRMKQQARIEAKRKAAEAAKED